MISQDNKQKQQSDSDYRDYSVVLVFADGPLWVNISGPDSAQESSMVTLTCNAYSRPDCDFYWHVDNHTILKTGPAITFTARKAHQEAYTCVAMNPVTNITLHQSKTVLVGEQDIVAPSASSFFVVLVR